MSINLSKLQGASMITLEEKEEAYLQEINQLEEDLQRYKDKIKEIPHLQEELKDKIRFLHLKKAYPTWY